MLHRFILSTFMRTLRYWALCPKWWTGPNLGPQGTASLLRDNSVRVFPLYWKFQSWKGTQSLYFSDETELKEMRWPAQSQHQRRRDVLLPVAVEAACEVCMLSDLTCGLDMLLPAGEAAPVCFRPKGGLFETSTRWAFTVGQALG